MKLRILSLLLLMLAVSLTACVGGQRNYSSGSGTQGETLNQQVARHDQQIQGILSQVGQVEQVLPGQAEMWSQMQTMRQEVNSMHGQIDDLNNQLSGSGSGEVGKLSERVNRIETLLRKIASQLAINTDSLDEPLPSSSSAAASSSSTAEGTTEGTPAIAAGGTATAATSTPPLLAPLRSIPPVPCTMRASRTLTRKSTRKPLFPLKISAQTSPSTSWLATPISGRGNLTSR